MIITRTPFRISFFGGGTDYPSWYRNYGGAVLATTIDKYCYITCRYLPPFFEHRIRVVYSKFEECHTLDEISHPVVREVIRYLNIERGLEIHHDGDLPARSGIGSSSAFTVGLLNALYALKGQMPNKEQLAREGLHIEQDILKESVGSQDQVLAAYGGFNHIVFAPNGELSVRPMTLSAERTHELNASLMLFYTGLKRTASNIADSYIHAIEDKRAKALNEIGSMVQEGMSILTGNADIVEFGKLLHKSWLLKRSLSTVVTNIHVDDIYEEARSAGAVGGKLIGAGGGGFMLLFARPRDHARIRERLSKLLYVPFKFEFSGSQIIFFDREDDYLAEEKSRSVQAIDPFKELST